MAAVLHPHEHLGSFVLLGLRNDWLWVTYPAACEEVELVAAEEARVPRRVGHEVRVHVILRQVPHGSRVVLLLLALIPAQHGDGVIQAALWLAGPAAHGPEAHRLLEQRRRAGEGVPPARVFERRRLGVVLLCCLLCPSAPEGACPLQQAPSAPCPRQQGAQA